MIALPVNCTRQLGVSLVELLVSMVIGLFIMAGVLQLFSTTTQNSVAVTGLSRIQENTRYAFSRIAEDIAQSGNLGCMSASIATNYSSREPITNMLSGVTDANAYDFLSTIWGKDGASSGSVNTEDEDEDGVAPGTDRFRIRYVNHVVRFDVIDMSDTSVTVSYNASDSAETATLPQSGQIVAVTNCSQGAVFTATGIDIGTTTNDEGDITYTNEAVITHTTETENIAVPNSTSEKNINTFIPNTSASAANVISPFYLYAGSTGSYEYTVGTAVGAAAACNSATAPQNCALFRSDSGTPPEEIVKGVHDIQVEYGWVDSAGNLRFAAAPDSAQWPFIDRMKVTMAFNSMDNVITNGNAIDQSTDGLLKKSYTRTFNLYNQL